MFFSRFCRPLAFALSRVAALERRKQEQEAEQQTIEAYYQARLEEMQAQYDRLLGEIDDAKRDAQVKVYKTFQDDAPVVPRGGTADRGLSAEGGTGPAGSPPNRRSIAADPGNG